MKKHKAEQAPSEQKPATTPTEPKAEVPAAVPPLPAPVNPKTVLRASLVPPKATGTAVATNNYSEILATHHDRGGAVTEQFRALRTHILTHYGNKRFSAIITSAEPGEGKTATCLNFGVVLAELSERTTVVVDADLRKGSIAACLNIDKGPGMAELIRGTATIASVVRPTVYPNLFVIPAGETARREAGELMGRPELKEIELELKHMYDFVLIDSPPVNAAADAGMLGQAVDGALLVVHMNKTHRESVDRAIRLLHASNVTVAGLILTHQKFYIPNYLYRYS